jgi:predicted nucleotidyltransferase
MSRDEVLEKLRGEKNGLAAFSVKSLAIFGSVARGEATAFSDVDLLVEFQPGAKVGLFEFVRLKRFLSELLGCPVDLVTEQALRKEMRDQILAEAIHAA